jgi:hypothetical protein
MYRYKLLLLIGYWKVVVVVGSKINKITIPRYRVLFSLFVQVYGEIKLLSRHGNFNAGLN